MQTVIVVDDEKAIREGLKRFLSSQGYRVLTAENGREALDVIRSEGADVVLCDLKMPVMGAVEMLEEVGAACPGLPVIILTGQGTLENILEKTRDISPPATIVVGQVVNLHQQIAWF